jgi:RNA polymerase sigma-70 factor, ECF subfamily
MTSSGDAEQQNEQDLSRTTLMEPDSIAKQLWTLAKQGDQLAFEHLFGLHTDRLLLYIRARLGGELKAKLEPEDILQDGYLAACRCFDDFDYADEGAFLRWMCRIIDNRLRDSHDHFAAQKRQALPLPRSSWTGPVTALSRIERHSEIEAALSQLRDEHREVLLLRYFQGLSCEEAGQKMQRSADAVECQRRLAPTGSSGPERVGAATPPLAGWTDGELPG